MFTVFLRFAKIVFIFAIGIATGYIVAQEQNTSVISAQATAVKQPRYIKNNQLKAPVKLSEKNIPLTPNKSALDESEKKHCDAFSAMLDLEKMQSLIADMQSQDVNARRRSLIALSLFGNDNIKRQIDQIISDADEEDLVLRRELIKLANWQGSSSSLMQLVDSTQSAEIKIAAIQSAQINQFDDVDRQIIGDGLERALVNDPDDSVKINALDYFANTNRDRLHEVIELLPKADITPEVQKHINFLTSPASERSQDPG